MDKPFRSFPVPFHSGFSWCARTILRILKSTCARTIHYSHPSNRRLQRSEVYQPKQDEDVFHIIRDDCQRPLPGCLAMDRVSSNLLMNGATPRPLAEIPSWCRRPLVAIEEYSCLCVLAENRRCNYQLFIRVYVRVRAF